MMELWLTVMGLIGWFVVGLINLHSEKPLSKSSYFIVWLTLLIVIFVDLITQLQGVQ